MTPFASTVHCAATAASTASSAVMKITVRLAFFCDFVLNFAIDEY